MDEKPLISMVAKSKTGNPFIVTHLFLKSAKLHHYDYLNPIRRVLFFLSNDEPSEDSIQKFYDFTFDQFMKKEYPDDEVLKPIACIDFNVKTTAELYDEIKLEKPVTARYLTCILKNDGAKWLVLHTVGCLGFVDESAMKRCEGIDMDGDGLRVNLPDGPYE